MTRRRLNSIRLDKIAAVDLPCQEHATVAIVKRAPTTGLTAMAKASFDEALNGAMVSERVNRAFWDSFDGLWQRNDAFRTALTDELAEGGDGSAASADYVASVNELVDTAVAAARSAGAKASDDDMNKAISEAATSWLAKSTPQPKEHKMTKFTTKAALVSAVASFAIAKSTVAEANDIIDSAVELDELDALDANPDLAKMAEGKKKKATDDKSMKSLQREVAVLKMAPAIRKHFDGLPADQQDGFIAKSDAERQAEVDAVDQADPVVHKCKDGTEIRKSDGAAVLALAKRNDALEQQVVDLSKGRDSDTIEKRAASEFPNVAKATAVDLLKSAATVGEDTDAGKAVLKSLKTMNDAGGRLFKSLGSTEGGDAPADVKKARQDFDTEVTKVAADRKISKTAAMSAVREERPDLYAAAYPENAAEEQDA